MPIETFPTKDNSQMLVSLQWEGGFSVGTSIFGAWPLLGTRGTSAELTLTIVF